MLKVIVKYEKVGYSKYLAHLEMVRLIERIMRRIHIPFDFSGGYNPRPQIAFAAPLSVGVSSEAEYFEIKLTQKFDLDKLINIDPNYLPEGISIVDAAFSEDKTSIMAMVRSASYLLKAPITTINEEQLREQLNTFLAKDEVMWKKLRKKKPPRDVNIAELINKAYVLNIK
jgi:radical SAM-linked protein